MREVTLWRLNATGTVRTQVRTLSIAADSFPVAIFWHGVVYVTSHAARTDYHSVSTVVVPG